MSCNFAIGLEDFFISIEKLSYISDTDNDGYLIASSINTSGELLDRNSSLERTNVSPHLKRFDVINEEEDEKFLDD